MEMFALARSIYLRPVVKGLATWIPGARRLFAHGTGGSNSPRYCYSVWLRHLAMARQSGLNTEPRTVAELGPGDSLGLGLCAVLSGSNRFFALDVVTHAQLERNLAMLDELVGLFVRRTPIPDEAEFPRVTPRLTCYDFPSSVLSENRLTATLAADRLERIRAALRAEPADGLEIRYVSPWYDARVVEEGAVDLVLSQAVLEHVEDLRHAYTAMGRWLRPGGVISACIDFRSHSYARDWNGHWGYSDAMWWVIRGNRPFLINREPLSTHRRLLAESGFTIAYEQKHPGPSALPREQLASRFRGMSDEDLSTQSVFVQAVKG